ncbi:MAG: glycoside hydrolase family 88 protein, partial [Prevotella sp.]|nr:glycoside hydrolase family 88 protein [Prevotella sp.]
MKKLLSFFALAVMLFPMSADAAKKKVKKQEPQLSTIEIIEKVNNQWQATHKPEVRAFWDDAAYFTGNMEAYKLTGNAKYLEYSYKWARYNKWSGAKEKDQSKWKYKNYGEGQDYVLFGDWQICFQTYLDMYEMNPDAYKIARAIEVMDRECAMKENDFWWWADALYMVMPVMTKMYKATGDVKYLDKLYDNFVYADNLMFDNEEHLYYRDGKYIYPKHKTSNGKKDFWARGDGWVLAGLAKVLADMPTTYKHYPFFAQRYRQMAAAVIKCQQKEGYWTRSMLDADHAEGPETSGTAFFTYGLLWGMNNGMLDKATYQPAVDKAWNYLTKTALQADGTVGYVQPIGEKAIKGQTLSAKSVTNFGTGAFLLAACEKVRFDDASVKPADKKAFTVSVRNDSESFRQEVVEIDANAVYAKLGISGGRQFQVINAVGQEVAYQITYDGKVLIDAAVRPCGVAQFTIQKGTPKAFKNTCYGRMYPERVDDIAWENDRTAYRCYGPALQRNNEKAYGVDVWLKNTPELVVENRYHIEHGAKQRIAELKQTNPAAADSLNKLTSYHYDLGNGLDCYKVGPTLGCGTPALMNGDNIIFPYCYKDYEILDNGPLRFTVKLVYNPATIKGDANVVENRILSLDKGSNFNKMTVW